MPLAEGAIVLLRASFADAEPEVFVQTLAFAADAWDAGEVQGILARLKSDSPAGTGVLYDPMGDPDFTSGLLAAIEGNGRFRGQGAEVVGTALPALVEIRGQGALEPVLEPILLPGRPDHTSVRFGDRLILKLFRTLEPGVNPGLEIGRYLTEQAGFAHAPRVAGTLEVRERRTEPMTLGILEEFIPNEGGTPGRTPSTPWAVISTASPRPGGASRPPCPCREARCSPWRRGR